jgi:hypothetical protein
VGEDRRHGTAAGWLQVGISPWTRVLLLLLLLLLVPKLET